MNKARLCLAKKMTRLVFLMSIVIAASCGGGPTSGSAPRACTAAWQQAVEEQLHTADSQGHGPDLGSMEWRSVVEFKLGIRGDAAIPPRDSDAWCRYIDDVIASY